MCCGCFAPVPGQHSRLSGSSAAGAVAGAAAASWGSVFSAAGRVVVFYFHSLLQSVFVSHSAAAGSSSRQQCWSWRAGGGVAAAGRCWHGSVAAGHRHGPCNGLVSGIRAQSCWLAVTPHLGAPSGTPAVAAPARGQGTCFQCGVWGHQLERPPSPLWRGGTCPWWCVSRHAWGPTSTTVF